MSKVAQEMTGQDVTRMPPPVAVVVEEKPTPDRVPALTPAMKIAFGEPPEDPERWDFMS